MNERKTFPSRLRQEHMEQTRDLIMEGLIRTMANGAVTWSIPEVARESRRFIQPGNNAAVIRDE